MVVPLLLGLALATVNVLIHGAGSVFLMTILRSRAAAFEAPLRVWVGLRVLVVAALALLSMHLVEVLVWTLAYVAIPQLEPTLSFEDAFYFSMVAFTTLGYGDITLTGSWRLLSGIESMTGIMLFGWTTALLIALVQRMVRDSGWGR